MTKYATVFGRSISDDICVDGVGGHARTVILRVSPGSMTVEIQLEADQAREIGLALMDAATAVEKNLDPEAAN